MARLPIPTGLARLDGLDVHATATGELRLAVVGDDAPWVASLVP